MATQAESLRTGVRCAQGMRRKLVVGVTSAQTCLVMTGRLRALAIAGFDVLLVSSPDALLEETAMREGVRSSAVRMERGIAPLADLRALVELWRLMRRERPAMVEFSTPKAGLLGTMVAWWLGVPQRVYLLRGLKLESSHGVKRWLLLKAERMAGRAAHVVLCSSESVREQARALKIGNEKKLVLLGSGSSNGVDVERFCPAANGDERVKLRGKLGIPEEATVVGYVGRLTQDKGIPELLKAFARVEALHAPVWLLLVGWFDHAEDRIPEDLQKRLAEHPRVVMTGYVAETAPYYRAMDMLVLPTHREGFPNVALEAAACSLAVITTESTGARDAVVAEVTGMLVPPGYVEALVEAIVELIHDAPKRRRMGEAGRRWVVEHFSREQVHERITEYYQRITLISETEQTAKLKAVY